MIELSLFFLSTLSLIALGSCCVQRMDENLLGGLARCLLCGLAIESALSLVCQISGIQLAVTFWIVVGAGLLVGVVRFWVGGWNIAPRKAMRSLTAVRWYEWLLLALIAEKLAFGVFQLANVPVYSEDAIFHWSGRARQLFGEVNWSWDPSSDKFLGVLEINRQYPLLIPLHRGMLGAACGQWSELLTRSDGGLCFIAIAAIVHSLVNRITKRRIVAAFATFVFVSQPLAAFHIAAGNADLAMAAFFGAAALSLNQKDWLASGALIAGAICTKNEGLAIYLPAFVLAMGVVRPWEIARKLLFVLGLAVVLPWQGFRMWHSLGVAPDGAGFGFHFESVPIIVGELFVTPTSHVIWLVLLIICLSSMPLIWRDQSLRPLAVMLALSLGAFFYVFTFTGAASWLDNEVTLQRMLLQQSPVAIALTACIVSRRLKQTDEDVHCSSETSTSETSTSGTGASGT